MRAGRRRIAADGRDDASAGPGSAADGINKCVCESRYSTACMNSYLRSWSNNSRCVRPLALRTLRGRAEETHGRARRVHFEDITATVRPSVRTTLIVMFQALGFDLRPS